MDSLHPALLQAVQISAEIVEFCKFLEPTPEEEDARESSLERISDLVKSMFPSARIQLFGSYLTGSYQLKF